MFIIVHSRRVGAQKWVKCGPHNSWMTPGLGFTHKLTILQAVKQERPIMNQQFTFISPHYSPGIRKHTRWWPYWWYILPYTEPVEPRGLFPSPTPSRFGPHRSKRFFLQWHSTITSPPKFLFDLTLCSALLAEEGIERFRGHHKMKLRFFRRGEAADAWV